MEFSFMKEISRIKKPFSFPSPSLRSTCATFCKLYGIYSTYSVNCTVSTVRIHLCICTLHYLSISRRRRAPARSAGSIFAWMGPSNISWRMNWLPPVLSNYSTYPDCIWDRVRLYSSHSEATYLLNLQSLNLKSPVSCLLWTTSYGVHSKIKKNKKFSVVLIKGVLLSRVVYILLLNFQLRTH